MKELIIISSHYNEDVSWIEKCGFNYLVVSKSEKDPPVKNFTKIKNLFSEEFRSYIYYILHNWDSMPKHVGFIHGHENSFHQQFPMSEVFEKLKKIKLDDSNWFLNLNGDVENPLNSQGLTMHCFKNKNKFLNNFQEIWNYLKLNTLIPPPEFVKIPPSAQILVKSERIKIIPKSTWEHIYNVVSGDYTKNQRRELGLSMEIIFPIILGLNPEKNIFHVEELFSFFKKNKLQSLISYPDRVWKLKTHLEKTIHFKKTNKKTEWIKNCLNNLSHSEIEVQ